MRTELGAHVRTSDGKDVGTIDRLIVDPARRRVKAAVIRKGVLLPRDVEVPLSALEPREGDVLLHATAAEVDRLPPFDESLYTGVPPVGAVPVFGYPMTGFYWPLTDMNAATGLVMAPPFIASPQDEPADEAAPRAQSAEEERAERENAIIREGSAVMSRDEQQVGTVEQFVFDQASGRLSHLLVRRGIIFTHTVDVPAGLIAEVDDNFVTLRVTADELQAHQTGQPA